MEDFDFRVVVLIIFLLISAVKWLGTRLKGADNKSLQSDDEESGSLEDIYEQYRQDILNQQTERLHEPEEPAFEQEPTFEPHYQEKAIASPPPLPATPSAWNEKPSQQDVTAPPATLSQEQKAALKRLEQRGENKQLGQKNNDTNASIRDLLTNPESAKKAVILTEILGKPKSMQDSSYGY